MSSKGVVFEVGGIGYLFDIQRCCGKLMWRQQIKRERQVMVREDIPIIVTRWRMSYCCKKCGTGREVVV